MDKISIILLLTIGLFAVVQSKPQDICETVEECIKCTSPYGCSECCDGNYCIDCDSFTGLCTNKCCESYVGCKPDTVIVN